MPFYKLSRDYELRMPEGCVSFKSGVPTWVTPIFKLETAAKQAGAVLMTDAEVKEYAAAQVVEQPQVDTLTAQAVVRVAGDLAPIESANQIGPNEGRFNSIKDAAHFMRQLVMGPTWDEIEWAYSMGSRRMVMRDLLYRGAYSFENPLVPNDGSPGIFATSAMKYSVPRTNTLNSPASVPHFDYPGERYTNLMLLNAFFGGWVDDGGGFSGHHFSVSAPDSSAHIAIRQRLVWALSKFIPCSVPGGAWDSSDKSLPILSWYATLEQKCFGTYLDLLEEVTYSPSMGKMLTYATNEKETATTHPDENYAREVMQLFTIGLYELNIDGSYKLDSVGRRIPTYDNGDITQMARVFTGLCRWDLPDNYYTDPSRASSMRDTGTFQAYLTRNFYDGIIASTFSGSSYQTTSFGQAPRMRHYMPFYETGAKKALGGRVDIPAGTDPKTNIRMALQALVKHPSCAPFVCKNLIKHLITSNPTPGYVARVARVFENNGRGVRGDLSAVWAAIYCDPEASHTINSSARHGRVRDGFEMYGNLVRTFRRVSTIPTAAANTINATWLDQTHQTGPTTDVINDRRRVGELGVWPWLAPSIFGYHSPEFATSDAQQWGMVTPELGATPSSTLMSQMRFLVNELCLLGEPRDTPEEYRPRARTYIGAITQQMYDRSDVSQDAALVDRLDLLLCGGTMDDFKKIRVVEALAGMPVGTDAEKQNRVAVALQLMVYSNNFAVI